MPRNTRNFWIDARFDGRTTRLDGGAGAERERGLAAEALGEAAGSRALAGYAEALSYALADGLAADALREAAEALEWAAHALQAAAATAATLDACHTAAAASIDAALASVRFRNRFDAAQRVERAAAARAWAAGPEVGE